MSLSQNGLLDRALSLSLSLSLSLFLFRLEGPLLSLSLYIYIYMYIGTRSAPVNNCRKKQCDKFASRSSWKNTKSGLSPSASITIAIEGQPHKHTCSGALLRGLHRAHCVTTRWTNGELISSAGFYCKQIARPASLLPPPRTNRLTCQC